ncbi:MAG: BatA domain-containing protein [Rhodothermia bacterium]|nr:MAG: BatA domain-containing protein [Rhodothermia bacterium]
MMFLNPLLLFGLAAAVIPLIIHLFNFRKPKRVEFSSLAFLHELKKSTMQRVRIKQWLLLALRTLAVALLVMAFARPTLTGDLVGSLGGRGRTSTAIVLDNSLSMLLRDGSGSYLEQARAVAAALVDEMQSGDELYLIPTVTSSPSSTAHQNQSSARQALVSIEAGEGTMILNQTVAYASDLLKTSANPNREIFVLSDLQESTFSDGVQTEPENETVVRLIPVGTRRHNNIAVSEIEVLSRILSEGEVVRMEATLINYGERFEEDVVVSLYLEGERVAHATTNLAAGDITRVPIAVTPRSAGWLGGQIEIQDSEFRSDDVRRFTLFIPEERRILVVGGQASTTAYIELALSEVVTQRRVRFDVERIEETALARATLGTYDTVVLSGVTDLSSGERAVLVEYVRAGGGLLIFPGDGLVISDYNILLESLGGGQIESITDPLGGDVSVAGFDQFDVEHALFEGMFLADQVSGTPRLEQPDIFRMITYQPGNGTEQTLIRLSGNRSFLQEIRHERGSVILFAVAPENEWSDFPVTGLFIPLLYRSIYYLSAGGSVMGEEFTAGSAAQIQLPGISTNATVTVNADNGDSYIPELRRSPGITLALIGSGFLSTGLYDVLVDGQLVRRFAVHPVIEESNLELLEAEEAAAELSRAVGHPVNILDLSSNDTETVKAQLVTVRTGVELWNVFMMLALVTLLAEMLVEKKWRPEAA